MNIFEAMNLVQKKAFVNVLGDFILKNFKKANISTSAENLSTMPTPIRVTTGGF